jgi:hypothetical protein
VAAPQDIHGCHGRNDLAVSQEFGEPQIMLIRSPLRKILTVAAMIIGLNPISVLAVYDPNFWQSPDRNTVTFSLYNNGTKVHPEWRTTMSLDGMNIIEPILDTGATHMCVDPDSISWMLNASNYPDNRPKIFHVGHTIVETANGDRAAETWVLPKVSGLGFEFYNVNVHTCAAGQVPLLGQEILGRFKKWSIDNEHSTITVVGPPVNGRRFPESPRPAHPP